MSKTMVDLSLLHLKKSEDLLFQELYSKLFMLQNSLNTTLLICFGVKFGDK